MRARDLAASPTVDLSKTGDILFTNAFVDNVLGTQEGFIRATALLYANGRDLKDPLLSPIYGDVHGISTIDFDQRYSRSVSIKYGTAAS